MMNAGMMKKMQKMQRDMMKAQKEIEESIFTATAGGGLVSVEVTGTKVINKISIKPDIVDPDDVETLEDVLMLALNEAFRQVDDKSQSTMGQFTQGLNLPGLF